MQFYLCCCEMFMFLYAVCSLLTLTGCQNTDESISPTEVPEGSGLVGTQAPPLSPSACLYFDSRTNSSRQCPLTSSCFAFIRRTDDGSFRVKRGCGSNCEPENRGRKIKVCCDTHLCNDHTLTPDNFTSRAAPTTPPTLCYQSLTNSTCEMSTACFSRLTYLSDGSYQVRQGCTRGSECNNRSENTVVKKCCTSHLCNTPLTPDPNHTLTTPSFTTSSSPPRPTLSPITTSTFTPPELDTPIPSSEPSGGPFTCFCSTCGPSDTCRGQVCANIVSYTERLIPDTEEVCITDMADCTPESSNPDPEPGTVHVICCDHRNKCNDPLVFPTFPTTPPATPREGATARSTVLSGSASSTSEAPTSSSPRGSHTSSDHLYFTLTVVVSVLSALIIAAVMAVLLAILIHHKRKSRQTKQPPQKKNTPLSSTSSSASSSTTSSSGELHSNLDLKHLGTSV